MPAPTPVARQMSPDSAPLRPGEIRLEGATRGFRLRHDSSRTLKELFVSGGRGEGGTIWALRDVDLHVEPGEAVGLIGRNGAGKTSTLRALAGIVPLDAGRVECGGRVVSLLELGAGFGDEFSGRENIYLSGALHGFSREQIEDRINDIIAFSELGDFIEVPVKSYSSGMFLRLGFSIVAHLDADVMLIDEILAVGDEAFQAKCLRRVAEHMRSGTTLVLVSHDPGAIRRVCQRVVVLEDGGVVFDGEVEAGLARYHEMTGTLPAPHELEDRSAGQAGAPAEPEYVSPVPSPSPPERTVAPAPELVLAEARSRAATAGYGSLSEHEVQMPESATVERLHRWALIEVEANDVVYSTRRFGKPITAVKRAVAHMLRQYNSEVTSQTTRFNVNLLSYVRQLEARVSDLQTVLLERQDENGSAERNGDRADAP